MESEEQAKINTEASSTVGRGEEESAFDEASAVTPKRHQSVALARRRTLNEEEAEKLVRQLRDERTANATALEKLRRVQEEYVKARHIILAKEKQVERTVEQVARDRLRYE